MPKSIALVPLVIILTFTTFFIVFGSPDYLSFRSLKNHRENLLLYVQENPIKAPLSYILLYIVAVTLSIPGSVFITLAGGFLFPQPFCTIYTVLGASCGALLIFSATHLAFGDFLKKRTMPFIKKMEAEIQENKVYYLLFLRLVPIFPFWVVNLAPAFFSIRTSTFFWTTCVGIIPGSFVFSQIGNGLGSIFDSHETFSIHALLNANMKIALIALGFFALLPVIVKYIGKQKKRQKK